MPDNCLADKMLSETEKYRFGIADEDTNNLGTHFVIVYGMSNWFDVGGDVPQIQFDANLH